jgi:hypothetical protein
MKIRTFSRKGICPECYVSTGSKHNKLCRYAYIPEEKSKAKKKTFRDKIKTIIKILTI